MFEELKIRTYSDGDEDKIVDFFNKAYENYAGFVPRTIEYWCWSIRSRPDVNPKGIFIAENGQKMVGYAAVAKSGEILEFCYDTQSKDAEKIVRGLLETVTEYVIGCGGNSVKAHALPTDTLIGKVCRDLGFSKSELKSYFISVLDFPQLIQDILKSKSSVTPFRNELFLIELIDAPSWSQDVVCLQFKDSQVFAKKERVDDPDVRIQMPLIMLSEIIFGIKKPLLDLLLRRIKVKPFWKFLKAVQFFSLLRLNEVFFTPIGDL